MEKKNRIVINSMIFYIEKDSFADKNIQLMVKVYQTNFRVKGAEKYVEDLNSIFSVNSKNLKVTRENVNFFAKLSQQMNMLKLQKMVNHFILKNSNDLQLLISRNKEIYDLNECNFDEIFETYKSLCDQNTSSKMQIANQILSCCVVKPFDHKIYIDFIIKLHLVTEIDNIILRFHRLSNDYLQPFLESFSSISEILEKPTFFVPTSIEAAIRKDDLAELQKIMNSGTRGFDHDETFSFYLCFDASIIHLAAFFGAEKCFKFFIKNFPDLVIDSSMGEFAVAGGNLFIIHYFDDTCGDFQISCLKMAIIFNRYEIFEWILQNKQILRMSDENSELSRLCIEFQRYEFLICLSKYKPLVKILVIAAKLENYDLMKILVNLKLIGVSTNEFDYVYYASLHYGCIYGNLEIVKLLFNTKNISINIKEKNNETPFYLACKFNHNEIVHFLMENDRNDQIEYDAETLYERITPLIISVMNQNYEIIQLLLTNNKIQRSINKINGCLHSFILFFFNNLYGVYILFFDKQSISYFSALHIACMKQNYEIVQLLLKQPLINVNIQKSSSVNIRY